MQLNELKPAQNSQQPRKRVGRGIGSGLGKTCGRGHKGQKARSGGYHKIGFEGGQMPIQMRLPKVGFRSRKALITDEIRLHELNKLKDDEVTMDTLRQVNLININIKHVKIILSGKIERSFRIVGIPVTKGARVAIEKAGGSIED